MVRDSETDFTVIEPILQMGVITSDESGVFFVQCSLNLGEGKGMTFDITQKDLTKDEAETLVVHAFTVLKMRMENKGGDILKETSEISKAYKKKTMN